MLLELQKHSLTPVQQHSRKLLRVLDRLEQGDYVQLFFELLFAQLKQDVRLESFLFRVTDAQTVQQVLNRMFGGVPQLVPFQNRSD